MKINVPMLCFDLVIRNNEMLFFIFLNTKIQKNIIKAMYKSRSVHRFRDFALKYEISVAKLCPSCFYCIVIKYFFYNYPEK